MSKHDTFDKYPTDSLDLPERALLTTWDCLAAYREDLVLIGGLAVRHLTKAPEEGLPGPVTLDVDFAITIGASRGMYGSIRDTLTGHDFEWKENRFVRKFKNMDLFIDLLTDDNQSTSGTVIVDDSLPVSILPGINRALACHRMIEITGKSLLDVEHTENIRVAEIGPMLVLKLNAFGGPTGRKAPKDAHDILYLAMNYLDGTRRAIEGFKEERTAGNRGFESALTCLETSFATPDSQGPVSCAAFRLNNLQNESQFIEESERIRAQCVTLAQALLA
jgi:hypothetical protein